MTDLERDTGLLNLAWAQALADGLAAAGVHAAVLSPGSRSTPLALAFLRQPAIRCHVLLDERSAAFFALGIARDSGQPVAVLCTSGTAPANWFPAVIEADAAGVPLLLLSADRPPELQGWGANQTVEQTALFGGHVRAFHAPGAPQAGVPPAFLHRLAARAVAQSHAPLPGPVHLNLPFREPLLPAVPREHWPAPQALPSCLAGPPAALPDPQAIATLAGCIAGQGGAIVCGGADYPPGFAEAVTALAGALGCPLLAEPLSGLRCGAQADARISVRYDAWLRDTAFVAAHRPAWVLRFGAFPVTRTLQGWLAQDAAPFQALVTPDARWPDPLHAATLRIEADPLATCMALRAAAPMPAPAAWGAAFAAAEARAEALAAPFATHENFEGALVATLLAALPAGHRLFCGNSLAIRALDAFSGRRREALRIFGNRGASGIDGNLSTALGIACGGPTVALVGDLTAQHDLTALAAATGHDIVFVVLNNGGGGIFDHLPQAALAEFETAWLTPQRLDFAAAAAAFGIRHVRADTLAGFRQALDEAIAGGGPRLLEVTIDRAASLAAHRAYRAACEAGFLRT